jgi:hypothetical protein
MLKTIAAALLAVSVLAAPAMAASRAPQAPVVKAGQIKPSVLNANAKMGHRHGRHHVKHFRRHHAHKRIGAHKTRQFSKVMIKHVTPAIKRG